MERNQLVGAACLLLTTAATVCLSGVSAGADNSAAAAPPPQRTEDVRRTLREYFTGEYSEAACSAIYADLTHDGVEELVVVELGRDRQGKPLLLHDGAVSADSFTEGTVTVLGVEADGGVRPLYDFTCGSAHTEWGELYLQKCRDAAYLVHYTPYTAAGRSNFEIALFSLNSDGTPVDAQRERVCFSAGGETQAGDAEPAEIEAFQDCSEELLLDAKPLLVYDIIHQAATGVDGPRRFSYLDELFTAF